MAYVYQKSKLTTLAMDAIKVSFLYNLGSSKYIVTEIII